MRLVQLTHPEKGRKVAVVQEPRLVLLKGFASIYDLANQAVQREETFTALVDKHRTAKELDYDPIYRNESEWRLLPAFDHPFDPLHNLLSGTGLTHKASADNRQKMHEAQEEGALTDSMKMYLWGVAGGRPLDGEIGVQPEWFYKGTGAMLRAHGETLETPAFGDDGGEEPEIAGLYLVDQNGKPWRVGFAAANEFSDHIMERKNYLYLAPSKIRTCSLGPELVVTENFQDIRGRVAVERNGEILWEKDIRTGEANMAHSLANLEHHHFKYPNHRVPGQVHIHFFGADAFSFGAGVRLTHGDVMEVRWNGMGRALRNRVSISGKDEKLIRVEGLR